MADLKAIVDGTVDDAELDNLSLDELKELRGLEEEREKPRTTMLAKIDEAIEDRENDDADNGEQLARQEAAKSDDAADDNLPTNPTVAVACDDDGGIAARNKTMEPNGLEG